MIKLEEKVSKIICSQHQQNIQYMTLDKSSQNKLLCSKCQQNNTITINKVQELLMDINQDHPLNYHIKELQKQYESLKKEIKLKVDELLNETEDSLNRLVNHKLNDKSINHYLYDDQLNEQDIEELQEILCKYYDFEQENQTLAKIPSNDMYNIYQIEQKCQKIASIIKAFYKSSYYYGLETQQTQENLSSYTQFQQYFYSRYNYKYCKYFKNQTCNQKKIKRKIKVMRVGVRVYLQQKKKQLQILFVIVLLQIKLPLYYSYIYIQLCIVCGLQGNNNEDNLVLHQKKNEEFKEFQTLAGHIGSIYAVCFGKINNIIKMIQLQQYYIFSRRGQNNQDLE